MRPRPAGARPSRPGSYGQVPASPDGLTAAGGWRTFAFPPWRSRHGQALPGHRRPTRLAISRHLAISWHWPPAGRLARPRGNLPLRPLPAVERAAADPPPAAPGGMRADTAAVQEPARAEGVPSPRVPEAAPAAAVAAPEAPALDKRGRPGGRDMGARQPHAPPVSGFRRGRRARRAQISSSERPAGRAPDDRLWQQSQLGDRGPRAVHRAGVAGSARRLLHAQPERCRRRPP